MIDISAGSVMPEDGNAICKAGDKVLRSVELEFQHGGGEALPLTKRRVLNASALASGKLTEDAAKQRDEDGGNRVQRIA